MCIALIGVFVLNTVCYSTDVISKTDYKDVVKKEVSLNSVANQVEVVDHSLYRFSKGTYEGIIFTSFDILKNSNNSVDVVKEATNDHSPDILNSLFTYKFLSDHSSLTLYSRCVYKYPDYKDPVLVPINHRCQER